MRQLLAIGCALVHNPSLLFSMSRLQASIRFTCTNLDLAPIGVTKAKRFSSQRIHGRTSDAPNRFYRDGRLLASSSRL